jgi:hypothetical protein
MNNHHASQLKYPPLQKTLWPLLDKKQDFSRAFSRFLALPPHSQELLCSKLERKHHTYGKFLHTALAECYILMYGYQDSPTYLTEKDELEATVVRTRVLLERKLHQWLQIDPIPEGLNQRQAVAYLHHLIEHNSAVHHELFTWLQDTALCPAFHEFLYLEALRSEVVDDEIALAVIGMQGAMKSALASNLWDECGRGNVEHFHTYWLRQLLHAPQFGGSDQFLSYRRRSDLWFAKITSNAFNMLLARGSYKYRAYGSFLLSESWVMPHFSCILSGLSRIGLHDRDVTMYFEAHMRIDPRHTDELLSAIRNQVPDLTGKEIEEVLRGAHQAIAAARNQYAFTLLYLQDL